MPLFGSKQCLLFSPSSGVARWLRAVVVESGAPSQLTWREQALTSLSTTAGPKTKLTLL
jgi:hypothetical protein